MQAGVSEALFIGRSLTDSNHEEAELKSDSKSDGGDNSMVGQLNRELVPNSQPPS